MLQFKIAPYALRPDVMRMLMMSAIDGRRIVGNPNDSNFGLYNLRLSSHTKFPDGLHAAVYDPDVPVAVHNFNKLPFPPEKITATRRVGEAIAAMQITASSLKVSYPLPEPGNHPVAAEVMGSFGSHRDYYNFEDTVTNRLTVLSRLEDEPNEHGVRISHFDCATHDGTIPVKFTMYQSGF